MRPERALLFLVPIIAGVAVGLKLPRWRTVSIAFERGGTQVVVRDSAAQPLPGRILIDDDGRLRLRVINRDTVPHQAGVLSVRALDSATVGAEACTGRGHGVTMEIVLR